MKNWKGWLMLVVQQVLGLALWAFLIWLAILEWNDDPVWAKWRPWLGWGIVGLVALVVLNIVISEGRRKGWKTALNILWLLLIGVSLCGGIPWGLFEAAKALFG